MIDPAANMVTVTVLASDDPAGLIGFNTDSRFDKSFVHSSCYTERLKRWSFPPVGRTVCTVIFCGLSLLKVA